MTDTTRIMHIAPKAPDHGGHFAVYPADGSMPYRVFYPHPTAPDFDARIREAHRLAMDFACGGAS